MARSYPAFTPAEYDAHIDRVLASMEAAARSADAREVSPTLVLFIHGGLNSPSLSVRRATEIAPRIKADNFYPLFLIWDSSLWSSHRDHLFFVRQGEDWGWWGLPLAPVYLASDLARVISRAPLVWLTEFRNGLRSLPGDLTREERGQARLSATYSSSKTHPSIDPGQDDRTGLDRALWSTRQAITIPTKLLTGPLLNGIGTNAWNMLQRRISLLFESVNSKDARTFRAAPVPHLLERLRVFESQHPEWEFTLVGHSMGCIVANRMLRQPGPTFSNVVYMAAASEVGDTIDSVGPYLAKHARTRFRMLTLHPRAEVVETSYLGLPPSGSLLTWIDGFLAEPRVPNECTAGQFDAAIRVREQLQPALRERVTVKAFSVGGSAESAGPTQHSDFVDYAFWKESLWTPHRRSQYEKFE